MRRPNSRTALSAATAALALSLMLTACSGDDEPTADPTPTATEEAPQEAPTPTAEDIAALEKVEVTGEGAETAVTLPSTPFSVSTNVARLLSEGDGEVIEEGDLIELHSIWVSGTDGSTAQSSWANGRSDVLVINDVAFAPVLTDILIGGKVGTRFAFASPSGDGAASVAVGEIVGASPGRAVGEPVEPQDGLPTISLLDNGAPTIEPVNADPTGEFVVQPLIEGTGPEVTAGQQVFVHYTGWLWGGKQFDSSWDSGQPIPVDDIGQGQVIAGWNEGLVGQKVGSQVLLVIPPEKGYGDEEKETIPKGSTLVFVVDVLAAR